MIAAALVQADGFDKLARDLMLRQPLVTAIALAPGV